MNNNIGEIYVAHSYECNAWMNAMHKWIYVLMNVTHK